MCTGERNEKYYVHGSCMDLRIAVMLLYAMSWLYAHTLRSKKVAE